MRISLVGSSMVATALFLAACNQSPNQQSQPGRRANLEQAQWSASTAAQLRDAIEKRATHGLDKINFQVTADAQDSGKLTTAALAYAVLWPTVPAIRPSCLRSIRLQSRRQTFVPASRKR
ncbi:hypothetical protein [Sphingomonas sp. AP4-R1]|uniref:hypothetical protein n=1 Tax=Sphingomonas sp. AP4-R1 TaxID=2735134 RepID=UPI00346242F5